MQRKIYYLKKNVGIVLKQIVSHIENGSLLDIIAHPNKEKFSHQQILIVRIENYVYRYSFCRKQQGTIFKNNHSKS